MTPKESEKMGFEFPVISPKTPNAKLKVFSKQHWSSDATKVVAKDMVNNVKELLIWSGSNIDWELVLGSIRTERVNNSVRFGEAAIAVNGARVIGALAADTGWSMDSPPIVYLSVKYLGDIVSDKFEDLKSKMLETAVTYGKKTLPDADSYMEILDFLLYCKDRNRHRTLLNRLASKLGSGNIEEAYNMFSQWDDLVRIR